MPRTPVMSNIRCYATSYVTQQSALLGDVLPRTGRTFDSSPWVTGAGACSFSERDCCTVLIPGAEVQHQCPETAWSGKGGGRPAGFVAPVKPFIRGRRAARSEKAPPPAPSSGGEIGRLPDGHVRCLRARRHARVMTEVASNGRRDPARARSAAARLRFTAQVLLA